MTERTAVASAGFWIFDDSLVALETPTASIEVTRPQEIELYARMFGHLQGNRRLRGRGARADHQNAQRTELAQHLATLWTPCLRRFYDRGMGNVDAAAEPPKRTALTCSGPGAGSGRSAS